MYFFVQLAFQRTQPFFILFVEVFHPTLFEAKQLAQPWEVAFPVLAGMVLHD